LKFQWYVDTGANGDAVEGDEKYPDVMIELYSHPWGLARILLESIDKKTCWK
jgi:hypothetical protein